MITNQSLTHSPPSPPNSSTVAPTGSARLFRRVRGVLLALLVPAVAMTALTVTAAPAQADLIDSNNAPNYTVAGYGVNVSSTTFCDKASRTMTINAQTSVMQAYGYGGMTTGPYDSGQWVRYNVWARDVNGGAWTQIYTWSKWTYISGITSTPYIERLAWLTDLGTNRVIGTAGHSYETLVQIDWWTNKENIVNFFPVYTQVFKTDNFNSYTFNPSRCSF